ncbi:PTS sugar transporter subunit IIA [Lactovum odontotermitis]
MIRKELIAVNKKLEGRFEAIQAMVELVAEAELISDKESFYQAVLAREDETVTSIGYQVAIPHGKSSTVKEPFVVFVKTALPFLWDERNGEEVNIIFLMGIPEEKGANVHLKVLSQLSRNLMNEDFREKLQQCETEEAAYQLLSRIS